MHILTFVFHRILGCNLAVGKDSSLKRGNRNITAMAKDISVLHRTDSLFDDDKDVKRDARWIAGRIERWIGNWRGTHWSALVKKMQAGEPGSQPQTKEEFTEIRLLIRSLRQQQNGENGKGDAAAELPREKFIAFGQKMKGHG
jgi:hypothetical protein